MPLDYTRRLIGSERSRGANRQLGAALAFVAGSINAGAFLAVKQYTSHMTGVVSSMADYIALGQWQLAAAALGALCSFVAGATTSTLLVHYALRRNLHSRYALPLLLEATLLLLFGLLGARLSTIHGMFVPATIVLLCFMMGLQNALITKLSKAEIRTTHVTGVVTDIGIELGKLLYWNRHDNNPSGRVVADRERLRVLVLLLSAFFAGGLVGAIGFQLLGYAMTLPIAALLMVMAAVPAADDLNAKLRRRRRKSSDPNP